MKAENSALMERYNSAWAATNMLIRQGRSLSGRERHCAFLNTGGTRFADVSAAVGLNLPDDGRSLALVDWDHDGDLDLWLSNRTAPRMRYFRNDYPQHNHYLSVKLQGTTCNRDAVGARLELTVAGDLGKKIKTLRAGDAFLSQSSKWIHFGLGRSDKIERLLVRWPGSSQAEEIRDIQIDRHYTIKQGTGKAEPWQAPSGPKTLIAEEVEVPESTEQARIVLVGRVPLPKLSYRNFEQNKTEILTARDAKPLLVNLWASWCKPCVTELAEMTHRERQLRQADLEVIALCVDDLDENTLGDEAALNLLKRIKFPFQAGSCSSELVASLNLVQQTLLDRKRPLPVPCSFLIDRQGQIAVIYKGPMQIEQVLEDLSLLPLGPEQLRDAAIPLPGRWRLPPAATNPMSITLALRDAGFLESAINYTKQLEEYYTDGRGERYVKEEMKREKLADLQSLQGMILLDQKKDIDAVDKFLQALDYNPDDYRAHEKLGQAFTKLGNFTQAILHFESALSIDSENANTHYDLAINLTSVGRHLDAVGRYREALRLRPDWLPAANNLAWILSTHPDKAIRNGTEAVKLARRTCELVNFQDPTGLDTLAVALAETSEFEKAVQYCIKAIHLAKAQGKEEFASRIIQRKMLFDANIPYRDPQLKSPR